MNPFHGGITSNTPQGALAEVWLNIPSSFQPADPDSISWAIIHEIMHNKVDVGSAVVGSNFVFNRAVINDIHTQGGGGMAAMPAQHAFTSQNKGILGQALPRRIPQYQAHLLPALAGRSIPGP
jgi:hypothetical protein